MNIGAIFDWDGVVVNSEKAHLKSWEMLAEAHGHTIPANFMADTFGKRNLEIIPNILKWTDDMKVVAEMSDEKEEYYRKIIADEGLPLVDGIEKFLQSLQSAGIPCAIGSSTPRKNLEQALDKLDFGKYFVASATMEDVSRGKPAPDVFLCASEKIGVQPRRCIVFEDSEAGIDAGISAKMKTVAVSTTFPSDFWESRIKGFPDIIIEDFIPMDASIIEGIWKKK